MPVEKVSGDALMPRLYHLEELRRRLIICLAAALLAALAVSFFMDRLLLLLSAPTGRLIFTHPAEAFAVRVKLAFYAGLFLAHPVILGQFWAFAAPGLLPGERRAVAWIIPLSSILFASGALFALVVVVPVGVRYLLSFAGDYMQPMISAGSYLSFAAIFAAAFGIIFQLPVATVILIRAGLLTTRLMERNRKFVILAIFILAGILTPPDVCSQLLMALPAWLLYELSILLGKAVGRREAESGGSHAML